MRQGAKERKASRKATVLQSGDPFGFGETTDCGVIGKECLIKQDYYEKLVFTDQISHLSSVPCLLAHISYRLF